MPSAVAKAVLRVWNFQPHTSWLPHEHLFPVLHRGEDAVRKMFGRHPWWEWYEAMRRVNYDPKLDGNSGKYSLESGIRECARLLDVPVPELKFLLPSEVDMLKALDGV